MSMRLAFQGRVALVTGAGNGLGREYALALAARGAKVIVNDLGGKVDGTGTSTSAADTVVKEIQKSGGIAVANYNSVENGPALVDTAIQNFGRLDIVINNAGILRDRSLLKVSEQDWDIIQNVHLKGAFSVCQAAWPHMKKQNYGRIIVTSSTAGLYGNFGQTNYSSAKMGLVGLSNTLGVEGAKYGIQSNAIAPTAGSRLSASVMPEDFATALKPEYVCPLVLWLCHEDCKETKGIFEAGAGWVSKLRLERTKGLVLQDTEGGITLESVRDNWDAITDWTRAEHPAKIEDTTAKMVEVLEHLKASSKPKASTSDKWDRDAILSHRFPPSTFTVSPTKLSLYALGIGCNQRTNPQELKYIYEGDKNFSAFPTFCIIPAQQSLPQVMGGVPGMAFNPMMLLHGEQHVKIHNQPSPSDTLISRAKFIDVVDKQKSAVAALEVETTTENGQPICTNTFVLVVRGKGGFGGPSSSSYIPPPEEMPATSPTKVVEEITLSTQAAIYRLSGDLNPLHIDPSLAATAGFDAPILHGMCTFGYGVRHVLKGMGWDGADVSSVGVSSQFAQ
eukprot:m.79842 g.79842  ORF g.79842 m.79842 type:complete len:562 (+) comp12582_c0_seq1:136-1821(+)